MQAPGVLDELGLLLRPAGGGVYLVSTGRAEQLALQRQIYGAATDEEVDQRFRAALGRIADARGIILGVPSDVGAGFRRGANLGPQAVRAALLAGADARFAPDGAGAGVGAASESWTSLCARLGVVDIGDVFVVPQLLHDTMHSGAQLDASRAALYPDVPPAARAGLPVAPLSIAERVLDLVFSLNERVVPFVIGGDHSCAWPVSSALSRVRKNWGIVQPDAHTDLLAERLGIQYCFATWSYHANELLGRGGRMVQVGIRATRYPRAHWETTLDVAQFWADACNADPVGQITAILAHLKKVGVSGVYFSNDIDGTDAAFADATGTPEPGGLAPEFVHALIRRLGAEIGLVGGDVMEVAPPLGPDGGAKTVALAASYFRATVLAALVK
jgi:agmatinase